MRGSIPTVQFNNARWRDELDEQLGRVGVTQIACLNDMEAAEAIRDLVKVPTAVGVLEFHPRVVGVERTHAEIILTVDIREAQQ